jgi:D-alanyl-D-alanine carboxypeptidase (penicillin-binding protein 5/6)
MDSSFRKPLALAVTALLFLEPDADAASPKKKKRPRSAATPPKSGRAALPDAAALKSGELPLAAAGAISLDAFTGEVLYEKAPDQQFYPASTTKILTALLVIEAGNLDQEVIITEEDARVGESSLEIRPGDRFTRRQMLYGLMLKSANDVAHSLARDNAGTMEAFAEKMTRRARELGALNSHFMNPHGLHHPRHYTTPRDLALISRAAMQQPFFRQLVSTRSHPWVGPWGLSQLRNHNRLLTQFPGTTGLKTGYTRPAQQVLASSALWGTREIISVVMHTNKPGIWEDSKLLLAYGFAHPPLTLAGQTLGSAPADAQGSQ